MRECLLDQRLAAFEVLVLNFELAAEEEQIAGVVGEAVRVTLDELTSIDQLLVGEGCFLGIDRALCGGEIRGDQETIRLEISENAA